MERGHEHEDGAHEKGGKLRVIGNSGLPVLCLASKMSFDRLSPNDADAFLRWGVGRRCDNMTHSQSRRLPLEFILPSGRTRYPVVSSQMKEYLPFGTFPGKTACRAVL